MNDLSLVNALLMALSFLLFVLFPIYAIILAAKSNSPNKLMWIVAILFTNFMGALAYWFVGGKK